MTPNTATAGTARTFSATVQKSGSGTVSGAVTTLFQSATGASGANAEIIGTDSDTFSGSSESYSISHTFASAGTFYLRACADNNENWQGAITESNENNNCGEWTPVTVSASSPPDLTAGAVTPTAASTGVSTTLSAVISNTGNAATGGSFTNLFQIDNKVDHGSVTATRTDNSPNLSPEGTDTSLVSYTFATQGTWYVRACADNNANWSDDIDESDENNNCGEWTMITISTPEPLAATCTVSPPSTYTNQNVTWTGSPTGGIPPYVYRWYGTNPLDGKTTNPAVVSYSSIGNKSGHIRVTDSTGDRVDSADCSNGVSGTGVVVTLPPPTASLAPDDDDLTEGESTMLRWTSTNTSSCVGTGFATGGARNGDVSTGPLNPEGTYNYVLDCTGTDSSHVIRNASIEVHGPTVTIDTDPDRVATGDGGGGGDDTVTVTWTANGVEACTVTSTNPADTGLPTNAPADDDGVFTNVDSPY